MVRAETHLDVQQQTRTRRRALRAIANLPWVFCVVLLILVVTAVLAPWLSPYDYARPDATQIQEPPVWTGGSWANPLGTDNAGRDVLSRLMFGARTSLGVALGSLSIATIVGTIAGLVSGYFGRVADAIIMRLVDAFLAMPSILIALLALAIFGSSVPILIAVIALVVWAPIARMVRAETLSLVERPFVEAARTLGASPVRIVAVHIFPNTVGTLAVLVSLLAGTVILLESALSFLGLGVQPPGVSWGSMLSEGRGFMRINHWLVTLPGLAILLTILSLNRIGDWLRDELDPKHIQR